MRKRKPWEPNPDTIYEDLLALAYPVKAEVPRRPRDRDAERLKWLAKRKARARAAGERRWAEQERLRQARPRWRGGGRPAPIGDRLLDRWVRIMQPGEWYARGDVVGRNHALRGAFLQKMPSFVERRRNPEWNGISARNDEPHWLYRLSSKGEQLRELLSLLD